MAPREVSTDHSVLKILVVNKDVKHVADDSCADPVSLVCCHTEIEVSDT